MAPFMPNGKVANRFDKLLRWHSGSQEIEPFRGYIFKVVLKKTEVKGKTRENP
ncbi:hypothetical protein MTR_2g027650 [Medicago truncatula]|uniref:Uncharacterized protein n=1 Tax=Medicago truncatula TaxID=3880 RepID=G7ISM1_MEDTR|nr:hypothetical protein MTR_2g027650 [Medicago truncatula]